ncbi:hypothetical protein CISIN_1g0022732mg, partial [Citrus sinensis]|jgi:hypothetical protein
MLVA